MTVTIEIDIWGIVFGYFVVGWFGVGVYVVWEIFSCAVLWDVLLDVVLGFLGNFTMVTPEYQKTIRIILHAHQSRHGSHQTQSRRINHIFLKATLFIMTLLHGVNHSVIQHCLITVGFFMVRDYDLQCAVITEIA